MGLREIFGGPKAEHLKNNISTIDGYTVTTGESMAIKHEVLGFTFQIISSTVGSQGILIHFEITCANCQNIFSFTNEYSRSASGWRQHFVKCPKCATDRWVFNSLNGWAAGNPFWVLNVNTFDRKLIGKTKVIITKIEPFN